MIELLSNYYEGAIPLRELIEKQEIEGNLVVPLGKDEEGKNRYFGFDDVPCLLVTGETGSGKSKYLDCVIISLLIRNNSNYIKFIMMDPKKIELNYYNDLDYLIKDTINDKKNGVLELEKVYKEYKDRKNNNIKLPHIFVIIDESCDLMKEHNSLKLLKNMIEDCDEVGIHFIIATNTPYEGFFDKELIDKIEYKLTFDLTSKAEASWIGVRDGQLLLTPEIKPPKVNPPEAIAKGDNKRIKIITPYISDEDIMKVVEYLKNNN